MRSIVFIIIPTILTFQSLAQETVFAEKDLTTKTFRNGDSLFLVHDESTWKYAFENSLPAYCYVENDRSKGLLYNWAAINDDRGLAPIGSQIPDVEDFDGLKSSYLQSKNETWKTSVRPYSGFNAEPNGYKSYDGGIFLSTSDAAYYWTNTKSQKARKSIGVIIWDGDVGYTIMDERRESFMSVRCLSIPEEQNPQSRILQLEKELELLKKEISKIESEIERLKKNNTKK